MNSWENVAWNFRNSHLWHKNKGRNSCLSCDSWDFLAGLASAAPALFLLFLLCSSFSPPFSLHAVYTWPSACLTASGVLAFFSLPVFSFTSPTFHWGHRSIHFRIVNDSRKWSLFSESPRELPWWWFYLAVSWEWSEHGWQNSDLGVRRRGFQIPACLSQIFAWLWGWKRIL